MRDYATLQTDYANRILEDLDPQIVHMLAFEGLLRELDQLTIHQLVREVRIMYPDLLGEEDDA